MGEVPKYLKVLQTSARKLERAFKGDSNDAEHEAALRLVKAVDQVIRERIAAGSRGEDPLVCSQCGYPDCHVSAWVNVNTDALTGEEGPVDAAFCPFCEQGGSEGYDCGLVEAHEFDLAAAWGLPARGAVPADDCRAGKCSHIVKALGRKSS